MEPVSHQTVKLSKGKHSTPEDGACVMELASMLAGEEFNDHPIACALSSVRFYPVQSSFPEEKQGEISGLSGAVSNLGSSRGTAVAGTIVVPDASAGKHSYAATIIVLGAIGADWPGRIADAPA